MPLGQQTALDPAFGPVGGIGAGFFLPPAEPSSSPRPCSATSSRSPSARQTVPPLPSTTSGIPLLPPILGTDHAPWNGDTSPWRLRLPTDSPCARHRRWHRRTADREPAAAHHQSDGCSRASALPVGGRSKVHPRPGSWTSLCSWPPAGAAVSSLLLLSWHGGYHKSIIRIGSKLDFIRSDRVTERVG
jgi:hypothetical protein